MLFEPITQDVVNGDVGARGSDTLTFGVIICQLHSVSLQKFFFYWFTLRSSDYRQHRGPVDGSGWSREIYASLRLHRNHVRTFSFEGSRKSDLKV